MKFKAKLLIAVFSVVILLIGSFVVSFFDDYFFSSNENKQNTIIAEDEKDDYEEDEDDENENEKGDDNDKKKKEETVTYYVRLSDQITRETTIKTITDSDGDGIYDNEDNNPTINNNYITKDENLNGIVDTYE